MFHVWRLKEEKRNIVAEIEVNHNRNMGFAKKMIDLNNIDMLRNCFGLKAGYPDYTLRTMVIL